MKQLIILATTTLMVPVETMFMVLAALAETTATTETI